MNHYGTNVTLVGAGAADRRAWNLDSDNLGGKLQQLLVEADSTNAALAIKAVSLRLDTGVRVEPAEIRWVATVRTTEVKFSD
jgi:hypothetical protein